MRIGRPPGGPKPPRRLRIASLFWVALGLVPGAQAADLKGVRRIVVVYPVSDGQPGVIRLDRSLRATLKSSSRETIEIYNEYLDAARFATPEYQSRLADFLRRKYADRKIDLVIPALGPSLDFVLRYRERSFPGVPVIFGAIERREAEARSLGPSVAGDPMRLELEATLETALRLHPGTRHVAIVAGRSATDSYWVGEVRRIFRKREGTLEFRYLVGLPMVDLLRAIANLPERTVVFYLHVFEDGRGETFVPAEVAERVAAAANAPVYGCYRTYLGRGIVGGRLMSFEAEGEKAGRLALRVLAGERLEGILPSGSTGNASLFDWRQLRRWGIREDALPAGSVVVGKPPDFWELYRWRIVAILSLCAFEAALIVVLFWERARRRHADERFRQAVAASPSGMVMIGQDGRIVLANPQAERLFGYQRDELVGKPVERLVPERFRGPHSEHRDWFPASPTSRLLSGGRELYGRRKDGSEFLVEIGLNPILSGADRLVLASVVDITERRRADESLRASQRELRALTGKLLQAQEAERRRIARELHDDLNQELALLAVHLDLLGQNPPASGPGLGERLEAMSDRVKALSSVVHDLSTVLHPSKLEQIGLVAAIRGLGKELAAAHGQTIEFDSQQVPAAIPDDVALCLYRIAQEALRNVVKHSGASRARVELIGDNTGICLRIADDGVGFESGSPRAEGRLGLVSMRERLLLVEGELSIDTRPMGGTRIEVRVPLRPDGVDPERRS